MLREVECLGDLQGPKFRVGELADEPIPLLCLRCPCGREP